MAKPIKFEEKIQNWICKKCDNDMLPTMYPRNLYKGILLECSGCYRQVDVEGLHEEIKI